MKLLGLYASSSASVSLLADRPKSSDLSATAGAPAAATVAAWTVPESKLVDINSATVELLETLPGIGKTYSYKIFQGRPYREKEDLLDRNIVPAATYARIKYWIRVEE